MREHDQEAKYITRAPVYFSSDLQGTHTNNTNTIDFNGPNSSFNDINTMRAILGVGKVHVPKKYAVLILCLGYMG